MITKSDPKRLFLLGFLVSQKKLLESWERGIFSVFLAPRRPTYPTPKSVLYYRAMPFSLAPFAFALLQAVAIHARVIGRDGLIASPQFASKAVLARLGTGIRALEGFLRRVLILMALEMEPDLAPIVRPENLARAKAKMPRVKGYSLVIYPSSAPFPASFLTSRGNPNFGSCSFDQGTSADPSERQHDATMPPQLVPIGRWLKRLDHLHALAKDPLKKARRLAFSLARGRHGLLMAPPTHPRLLLRWGTEASAIHDAMALQITLKSRLRPPPLPPPRRGPKPTITYFW